MLTAFVTYLMLIASADQLSLQGRWVCETTESDGAKLVPRFPRKLVIIFRGTTMFFTDDGPAYAPMKMAFTVDPLRTPKTMDAVAEGGRALGIYRLSGDDLWLCFKDDPDLERPSDFRTTKGSGLILWKLRRAK